MYRFSIYTRFIYGIDKFLLKKYKFNRIPVILKNLKGFLILKKIVGVTFLK